MADFAIHGGSAPIPIGGGYELRAPGLKGIARTLTLRVTGARGVELATPAFDQAFANAQMQEVKTIEMDVNLIPLPSAQMPLRGPNTPDAFELRVPDQGPEFGQVVLSMDEAGAMQWHFPVDDTLAVQTSTVRGASNVKVFRIPRAVASKPPANLSIQKRGLLGITGKKLLKVLIYPIADAILGPLTTMAVSHWEEKKRPHKVRNFLPDNDTILTSQDWTRLASGRALLFVHGTFSTAQAGFGDLNTHARNELVTHYGGRVFAFDHPTLSVDPDANAKWFFSQVPSGLKLDLDIICHSRGGLVSRSLGGQSAKWGVPAGQFKVQKLILAGVPNMGTPLVNPDHMVEYLDRLTTCLDVFPDNGVTDILEGILTVIKVIGHAGLVSLDGLEAMAPGNTDLNSLNQSLIPNCTTYGIGSDFEPKIYGLAGAFCKAADSMVDRIFDDAPNDLVVPCNGMRDWDGKNQIADSNYLYYPPEKGISHTQYFNQPQTAEQLLAWLLS